MILYRALRRVHHSTPCHLLSLFIIIRHLRQGLNGCFAIPATGRKAGPPITNLAVQLLYESQNELIFHYYLSDRRAGSTFNGAANIRSRKSISTTIRMAGTTVGGEYVGETFRLLRTDRVVTVEQTGTRDDAGRRGRFSEIRRLVHGWSTHG